MREKILARPRHESWIQTCCSVRIEKRNKVEKMLGLARPGVCQHRCWWLVLLDGGVKTLFFLQWIEHGWIRSKTWTDKLDWEISAPVQWVNSTSTSSIKQFLVERRLSEGVNVKTTTKIQNSSLSKGSLYSTESSEGLGVQCYRQSGVRSTINFQLNWLPTVFSALWSYVGWLLSISVL